MSDTDYIKARKYPRLSSDQDIPAPFSFLDPMSTERGFIALSEKEKHARISGGVDQDFGMLSSTFLQMDCGCLTALPCFSLPYKGAKQFFWSTWQLGAKREAGEQTRWVSQSISIYITQFRWQKSPCTSQPSSQTREETGERRGIVSLENFKSKAGNKH